MNIKEDNIKVVATNRKARYDYHILSTMEAGVVLFGTEVKSIRDGGITLKDSYITFRDRELFLIGAHISQYMPANRNNHDPERERKLLLNRREINKIEFKIKEKGVTLIPLQVYIKNNLIKIEVGIARGKRLYDKRESIAQRDYEREKEREWKYR